MQLKRLFPSLRSFLKERRAAASKGLHSMRGNRQRQFLLLRVLGGGLVAVVSTLAFVLLAGEVVEGDTRAFDLLLLHTAQSLQAAHPRWFEPVRDFSGLGSTAVMTVLTTLTVGYLALVSLRTSALLVAASVFSGALCVKVLKVAFGRARPDTAYAELVATTLSFPSGHATMSAVVFLTLGALVAHTRTRWIERLYILGAAAVMTLLVGMSRVALGVHWATDVLAGWAFGSAWAIAWLLWAGFVERRRLSKQNEKCPAVPGASARPPALHPSTSEDLP